MGYSSFSISGGMPSNQGALNFSYNKSTNRIVWTWKHWTQMSFSNGYYPPHISTHYVTLRVVESNFILQTKTETGVKTAVRWEDWGGTMSVSDWETKVLPYLPTICPTKSSTQVGWLQFRYQEYAGGTLRNERWMEYNVSPTWYFDTCINSNSVPTKPQIPTFTLNNICHNDDFGVVMNITIPVEDNVDEYSILKSETSGGTYVEIERITGTTHQIVDDDVDVGETYWYKVVAMNDLYQIESEVKGIYIKPYAPIIIGSIVPDSPTFEFTAKTTNFCDAYDGVKWYLDGEYI